MPDPIHKRSIYIPQYVITRPEYPFNATVYRLLPLRGCHHCGEQELIYLGDNTALCPVCETKIHFGKKLDDLMELRNYLSRQARALLKERKSKEALFLLIEARKLALRLVKKREWLSDLEMAAEIYFDLGEAYFQLGENEKALENFKEAKLYRQRALLIQEDDIALYMLAAAYMRQWETLSAMERPFGEWKEYWEKEIETLEKARKLAAGNNRSFLTGFIEHERGLVQDELDKEMEEKEEKESETNAS